METKEIQLKEDKLIKFDDGLFVRLKKDGKIEILESNRIAG